jgi:cytochrome c2
MRTDRPVLPLILWHALAIATIACLPAIKFGQLWWHIPKRQLLPAVAFICAYALSAFLTSFFVRGADRTAVVRSLLITLSVFGLCLFALVLLGVTVPRYVLLPAFLVAIILIPLSVAGPRVRRMGWIAPIVGSAAALLFAVRAIAFQPTVTTKIERSFLHTAFYDLQVSAYEGLKVATRGGGLDRIGDQVLLGTGDGRLYLLNVGSGEHAIEVQQLPTIVPANREEFAAAFGGSAQSPARSSEWTDAGPPRVQTWRFRVADVIAQTLGSRVRLFASHHYWHADRGCFVVRVSTIEGERADLAASLRDATWQTLYETNPCVPLTGEHRRRGKNPFKGEEVGGRLALLDSNTLLLTLGDHGFHGIDSLERFAQDPNGSYGKTIRIDVPSGEANVFTLGHRNPQGLFVADDGRIWETEHGSQGGDELNLLAAGTNYGWPEVTYGTEYGASLWPLSQQQGRHDGYVQPHYVWVPSIGASNLVQMQGESFPIWRGDFIVGSLATRSLYRLVLNDDRVLLSEPIDIKRRVRDLLELQDGRLLVWTDDTALLLIEPAQAETGAALFASLCLGCHQTVDGITHRIGPDLFGVVDRGIADAEGFGEYSAALRSHPGRWTRAHLDAYLRDPQAFAPGTTMAFPGISDPKEREALIDYLAGLERH